MLGVTSYGDLSPVRAAAKPRQRLHPVDRRRGVHAPARELDPAVLNLRKFIGEIRFKNAEIPIYLYGETRTSQHIPNDILRELHGFIHMFEDTPEFVARHIIREAKSYLDGAGAAVLQGADRLRAGRLVLMALPGPLGRRGVPEEPGGPDVPPVLRREHAARRRLQLGRGARPAARPHRPGGGERAQRGAHLQRRPLLLRHQRHQHQQQDGVAPHRGAGRRGGGRPQLPQVDPALDHHDRRGAGVPHAHAQPPTASSGRSRRASSRRETIRSARSPPTRCWPASTPKKVKPRILTITQSTYDGVLYNTETDQGRCSTATIDTLHFDEAWLPHAAFHPFYGAYHAMGKDRAAAEGRAGVRHAVARTSCWPASARPRRCWCRIRRRGKLDRHLFNEAYLMHTSTSPQYAIIASLRRGGGDDGAARRHRAGGGKHPRGAGLPARDAQGRARSSASDWWFKVWGPDKLADRGHRQARRLDAQGQRASGTASATWRRASTCSTRSRARSSRRGWT